MTQPPFPAPPAPSRAPGPSLAVSIVVIAIGVVIGVASAIAIALPVIGAFTSTAYAVPGDIHLHLRHARYAVFQHTETRSPFGSTSPDPRSVRILPSQLSVVAPDGSRVPVSYDSSSEVVTRSSDVYRGSLEFRPPAGGDYVLRFTNPTPTSVIVARSLTDAFESSIAWFGAGAVGGVVFIAGVVMLIVGATRRSRAKRAMYAWGYGGWPPPPAYGAPPPQWGGPAPQWGVPPPAPPPPSSAPPRDDPWAPRG